jgi:hypothetical protein
MLYIHVGALRSSSSSYSSISTEDQLTSVKSTITVVSNLQELTHPVAASIKHRSLLVTALLLYRLLLHLSWF